MVISVMPIRLPRLRKMHADAMAILIRKTKRAPARKIATQNVAVARVVPVPSTRPTTLDRTCLAWPHFGFRLQKPETSPACCLRFGMPADPASSIRGPSHCQSPCTRSSRFGSSNNSHPKVHLYRQLARDAFRFSGLSLRPANVRVIAGWHGREHLCLSCSPFWIPP